MDLCSIIYCLERSTCDDLSAYLKRNGTSCAAYHAGLNNKARTTVLDDWISSRTQVVVATVAFGMGIDRKDVRFVCHYNIPKSMESFYQESGRAGRDHLPSRSLLYYGLDDRRRLEFIIRNAGTKKQKSSASSNDLVEKSLEDFARMVEYCEEPSCRRKQILESFGEKVSASLCQKTCDACRHPGKVSVSLQKLGQFSSNGKKSGLSPVFITRPMDFRTIGQETEFWNREDEEDISEEDISVSDDEAEAVNCHVKSKMSKARPKERIELLQHAEEMYYANKGLEKQAGALSDKKAISETLREAARQRLLNALKQVKERLETVMVEPEAAAVFLETECYKKFAKVGKTFYNSQVASTVRWLSSSSHEEVNYRLSTIPCQANATSRLDSCPAASKTLPSSSTPEPAHTDAGLEDSPVTFLSAAYFDLAQFRNHSQREELPPIPSFSEFMAQKRNAGKSEDLPALSQCSPALVRKRLTDLDSHCSSSSEKRGKMH